MFVLLLILFIVIPLIEIAVIVQVAQAVGGWNTVGLLLIISIAGAWLVRREGFIVMRNVRMQLNQGHMPTNELIDGVLLLIGGLMMLTPGFVTDALGLLLVFPITRRGARTVVRRRFATKTTVIGVPRPGAPPRRDSGFDGNDVIDV